ncbi:MAG: (2Fe-2S)-binding protein [Candidatus Bathyarchaeia archaeon]
MRVWDHPILGKLEENRKVVIEVDGKSIEAFEGEPIAAALAAAGIRVFRKTAKRGEPRGIYCAIGLCTDCVMIVDDIPNVRTCITPVKEGMKIRTQIGRGEYFWK